MLPNFIGSRLTKRNRVFSLDVIFILDRLLQRWTAFLLLSHSSKRSFRIKYHRGWTSQDMRVEGLRLSDVSWSSDSSVRPVHLRWR